MKKLFLMAMTIVAFAACSDTSDGGTTPRQNEPAKEASQLNIRLEGINPATRAIADAATAGQLTLRDGHILIINAQGAIVQDEVLDVLAATGPNGQEIASAIPSDSRIYIVGNIPSSIHTADLKSLDEIQAKIVHIAADGQSDYKSAILANVGGLPTTVTLSTVPDPADSTKNITIATATINIAPLFSRLELFEVVGDANTVSFDVVGVYVDDYHSAFTLTGDAAEKVWHQSNRTDFTGNIGDSGLWTATGSVGDMSAIPDAQKEWAYHVASTGLPRLIVALDHVSYNDTADLDGDGDFGLETFDGVHYITVKGYAGSALSNFERGKIYQIEQLVVDPAKLGSTPNPTDVEVIVNVKSVDWAPVVLSPEV